MNNFVPISSLNGTLSSAAAEFLSDVLRRDAIETKEGTDKAGILRRMQNEQCQKCHEEYKKKHPGQQFAIKCFGIYDDPDYESAQQRLEDRGDEIAKDDIREVYDPAFWGSRHMVARNDDGDILPVAFRWYQEQALRCTSARKVDRWGRGMGKALPLDTAIPSPSGWTTMGDIEVGDTIFDADGKPTAVTFVTDVMYDHVCYDVIFSDGSVVRADKDHRWETWDHTARKAESRKERRTGKLAHTRPVPLPQVRTTEDIKNSLYHGNGKRKEHNHSIVLAGPVEYPEKNLPVDPYVLGAWLGDGTANAAQLTSNDPEICEEIQKRGVSCDKLKAKFLYALGTARPTVCPRSGRFVSQGSLYSKLKALDLINNKHIPVAYMQGSIQQRLDILRGLMDTDGDCSKSGLSTFNNTNKLLADGVAELVVSLGIKVGRNEKPARLNGKDFGICYRVTFTTHIPVFNLQRKRDRQKAETRSTQSHRYIVAVKEAPSVPVKCITVDNPRHLYLVGPSFIPTHNTFAGVTEELHFIANNKNTYTVVICPSKAQSQVWWDEINFQLEHSPSLAGMLVSSKQQPYFYFRFDNGGVLAIFTAGSKSGKGADAVRGQSPRRIRLDEQDFLADKDYQAIMPLLRRFSGSTFHGSSTPSGLRGMYWQMCNKMREYKEFYHPITQHPQWGTDQLNEESCLSEAKTMDRYLHEWLAEFGNPTAGVFKSHFVDLAMKPYRLSDCFYNPNCRYILGIDWNGKGTGTRICVVEYNPENKRRRLVAQAAVDDPKATTKKSFAALVRLNREWHCDHVYVDAGFGFVQDELIRDLGVEAGASDPDTARLKYINVIDFGAKLETNRIVPMRDPNSKYLPDPKEEELQRRTKPFIVEGTAMAFEMEYAEISRECALLEEQLRGYRVKTWSKGGAADTYETDAESGDHDLDAYMLAMLGVELNYGLWHTKETIQRLVKISHLSGWGMPADPTPATVPGKSNAQLGEIQAEIARETRSQKLQQAGIPARAEATGRSLVEKYRLLHLAKGAALLAPNTQSASPLAGNKVPSRTSIFGATGRPTGGHRFSRGF